MVKVFVAIDEPSILVYMVIYKTKAKNKFVNKWRYIRTITTWRYKR